MAATSRDRPPNRSTRSVVALLVCVFCSSSASVAQTTILGKQIYDITGRALDLGLLGLAEFAPAAVLVLVAGSVADRFDRRRVTAVAMVGEALVAVALALYASSTPTAVLPIYLLALLFGVARAFGSPAVRSLPADIAGPDRLPWLVPRYAATWQAALVFGPVLGGFLYTVAIWMPYVACALLLLVGAVAALAVDIVRSATAPVVAAPSETARPTLHDALEGLRFIRAQPILLGAISLDLFAVLFGGAIALLPAIAENRLGVGAVGLGWLRASGGIGAALVTLMLTVRPLTTRVGKRLLAVVAIFGLGTIVLALTRQYVVAFLALAVLSGADAISVFIRATLVPLATPEAKRGRVLAVENVFIGASNELGAFESGVAAQLIGTTGAVLLGGVATLAIAGGWWFLFPALREVDAFPSTMAESQRGTTAP